MSKEFENIQESGPREPGSAIAIGNFDGFHRGHVKIIETLKEIAARDGLSSVIMTFEPNPKLYFKRLRHLVQTAPQKKTMLEQTGVDRVVVMDFREVVDMSDDRFLSDVLVDRYRMKHIVMGENFRFGKGRHGDISLLQGMGEQLGFGHSVVRAVRLGHHRISSTYVRGQLAEGNIRMANRMLGRHYSIEGTVIPGHGVGQGLGYPTINLDTPNTLLPDGVFKTRVHIDGQYHEAITYTGYRPTFQGKEKKVETHIFGFDRDLYGRSVTIFFDRKIRDEMTFESEDRLVEQIKKDIEDLKDDLDVDKDLIF